MKNMIRHIIAHSDALRLHKHIVEMRGEAAAKQDVEDVGRELNESKGQHDQRNEGTKNRPRSAWGVPVIPRRHSENAIHNRNHIRC
jgi:hypothetical protein